MSETIHPGMTAESVAAARELQTLEAGERAGGRIDVSHSDAEDGAPLVDSGTLPPVTVNIERTGELGPPPPLQGTQGDAKRNEIINRMRGQRAADQADAEAEGAEILAQQADPGLPYEVRPEVQQPNGKIKLTVRGRDIEIDPEELVALAQKSAAGDSYLDESRRVLDDAKRRSAEMLEAARAQADFEALKAEHPPVDSADLEALYDSIAYADPDEAKLKLAEAVQAKAREFAQAQSNQLEVERSKVALTKWVADNPELSRDDVAMGAVERRLFVHMIEDMSRLGFDVSQLKDNDAIANMHMRMRAGGHGVRPIGAIFDASKADYLAWRSGQTIPPPQVDQEPPQRPVPRQAAPRLEVTVNREARRANIPTQPPRSASPLRAPMIGEQPDTTQGERRSAAALQMQRQRRAARGGAV
jgi:hypothetical protein